MGTYPRFSASRVRKLFIGAALLGMLAVSSQSAGAQVEDWQQGVNVRPHWSSEFASESFQKSLLHLAQTNANSVSLLIPLYQSDISSTDIDRGRDTPTDEALVAGIQYARDLGFNVALKPHMQLGDGRWRAQINPPDREEWFNAYGTWLNHYADIAEEHGVGLLVIGAELAHMSSANVDPTNTTHWQELIQGVRERYSGELTYSANWGGGDWRTEKDWIEFWGDLDYIGISAFFEFGPPYTLESLLEQWERLDLDDVKPLVDRYDRPVLFAEVGYRSMEGTLAHPWDFNAEGPPDQDEQALAFEAFFTYWDQQPSVRGVHIWEWRSNFSRGDAENDTGYTPQHKRAEEVIAEWFAPGVPSALEAAEAAVQEGWTPGEAITTTTSPPADGEGRGPNWLLLSALGVGAVVGWRMFAMVRR